MGTADYEAALAVIRGTSVPVHDIGTAVYLSPDVFGWAAEWGWSNPFSFYFSGRGGMLGDVGPEVVCAALGWFTPTMVETMFVEGAAVKGASAAATRMAEAHALWGQKYLGEVPGLADIVAVTESLVDGLEGSGLPLFAVGALPQGPMATPGGRPSSCRCSASGEVVCTWWQPPQSGSLRWRPF